MISGITLRVVARSDNYRFVGVLIRVASRAYCLRLLATQMLIRTGKPTGKPSVKHQLDLQLDIRVDPLRQLYGKSQRLSLRNQQVEGRDFDVITLFATTVQTLQLHKYSRCVQGVRGFHILWNQGLTG